MHVSPAQAASAERAARSRENEWAIAASPSAPQPTLMPPEPGILSMLRAAGRAEAAGVRRDARAGGLQGPGPGAAPSAFGVVVCRGAGGPRRCLPLAAPPSRSSFLRAGARPGLPSPPPPAEAAHPASSCAAPRLGSRSRGGAGRRKRRPALLSPPSLPVPAAAPPPACDPLPHVSGAEGRRRAGPTVAAATGAEGAVAAARRSPAASSLGPAGSPHACVLLPLLLGRSLQVRQRGKAASGSGLLPTAPSPALETRRRSSGVRRWREGGGAGENGDTSGRGAPV